MFHSYWFILSLPFGLKMIESPKTLFQLSPFFYNHGTQPPTPKSMFQPVRPFSSKELTMKSSPSTIAYILEAVSQRSIGNQGPPNTVNKPEKQGCALTTLTRCGSTLPIQPLYSPSLQPWTGRQ